jgi:hypothetical protein
VRQDGRSFVGVKRVDCQRTQSGERFVVTHLSSHRVSSRKTANRSRSFCIANRIRVFHRTQRLPGLFCDLRLTQPSEVAQLQRLSLLARQISQRR